MLRDPAAVRAEIEEDDDSTEPDERYQPPTFPSDVSVPMDLFGKLFDKLIMCKALPDEKPTPGSTDDPEEDPPAAPGGAEGGCWLQHKLSVLDLDGGLPTSPKWCFNQQWRLKVKSKCQIIVAFGQRERFQRRVLGLHLVKPAVDPGTGAVATRSWVVEPSRIAGQAGPTLAREIVCRFTITEACDLFLVPWQYADRSKGARGRAAAAAASGGGGSEEEGRFTLRVWCDVPCTLEPLPPLTRVDAIGSWDIGAAAEEAVDDTALSGRTDGGRWPAITWALNPQFAVCSAADGRAMVVVERLAASSEGDADAAATGEQDPNASDERPPKPDMNAVFDPSNAIGARVVHAEGTMGVGAAPLHVMSGMSGSYRDASGAMTYTVHHALERSESDLEINGLRGKQKPQGRYKPPVAKGKACADVEAAAVEASRVARAVASSADRLEVEFGYESEREASGLIQLTAGAPLLIVPSLASSGLSGRFRVSVWSSAPVALHRISGGAHTATINGEWSGNGKKKGSNAGGCHLEGTWGRNPQYAISVDGHLNSSIKIVLRRPEVAWAQAMQKSVVESMAGFYLLRAPGPCEEQGRLTLSDKASADAIMVHETCFAPTLEVSCTVNLNGSTTLVLVPATYAVGQQGPFEIELASDQPVRWSALG